MTEVDWKARAVERWGKDAERHGLTIVAADSHTLDVNAKLYGPAIRISKLELDRIVDVDLIFELAIEKIASLDRA